MSQQQERSLAEALPAGTRLIVEALAEQMDAGSGSWRLEFEFTDGRLRRWYRHEVGGANGLERFDPATV